MLTEETEIPELETRIEKGYYIRTVIFNLQKVAKKLRQDFEGFKNFCERQNTISEILHYFAFELDTCAGVDRLYVNSNEVAKPYLLGAYDARKLKDVMKKYVEIYVRCKDCNGFNTGLVRNCYFLTMNSKVFRAFARTRTTIVFSIYGSNVSSAKRICASNTEIGR